MNPTSKNKPQRPILTYEHLHHAKIIYMNFSCSSESEVEYNTHFK